MPMVGRASARPMVLWVKKRRHDGRSKKRCNSSPITPKQKNGLRALKAMQLKTAGAGDVDILQGLHQECFSIYWNNEVFTDFFSIGGTRAILSLEAEKPIGMVVWRVQFEQAEILTLAVLPKFRRCGVARALVMAALADCLKAGADTLFLDVEEGNDAAIALYESLGFTHIRRRKLYYRKKDGTFTDALVMKKKIA